MIEYDSDENEQTITTQTSKHTYLPLIPSIRQDIHYRSFTAPPAQSIEHNNENNENKDNSNNSHSMKSVQLVNKKYDQNIPFPKINSMHGNINSYKNKLQNNKNKLNNNNNSSNHKNNVTTAVMPKKINMLHSPTMDTIHTIYGESQYGMTQKTDTYCDYINNINYNPGNHGYNNNKNNNKNDNQNNESKHNHNNLKKVTSLMLLPTTPRFKPKINKQKTVGMEDMSSS